MSFRVRFALLLLAGWVAASPAAAGTMGPLESFLLLDGEGVWNGALSEDSYRLENTDPEGKDENRYAFLDPRDDAVRHLTIAVRVRRETLAGDESYAFSGILYGLKEKPRSYLVFGLDNAGKVAIFRRNQEGMQRLKVFGAAPVDPQEFNELRVVEDEGIYRVFINEELAGTIQTELAGKGGVGIFVRGTGTFFFRDFALTPTQ